MICNLVWYILTNGRDEQSFLITAGKVTVTLKEFLPSEDSLVDHVYCITLSAQSSNFLKNSHNSKGQR